MSEITIKKPADQPRIGDIAAMQPLSGVSTINETFAVHGYGRGAYVRLEEADKGKKAS